MINKEKEMQRNRKDVAKRLRMSDISLWGSLSGDQQSRVVDKYLTYTSIEHVGFAKIFEENRTISRNIATVVISAVFGLTGSIAGNLLFKYLPLTVSIGLSIMFILLVVQLILKVESWGAESLAIDGVLEKLVDEIEKEVSIVQ